MKTNRKNLNLKKKITCIYLSAVVHVPQNMVFYFYGRIKDDGVQEQGADNIYV
jgi:hypothetical protein